MKVRYANVAATLAVVIAASSGAYAVTLAKNSVKSRHIAKNAVTKSKIGKNSVVSAKVKNGSLRAADFKASDVPQGAPGIQGEQGDPGLAGLEFVREQFTGLGPGGTGVYTADCPTGKTPISGGFETSQPAYLRTSKAVNAADSTSLAYDGWRVVIHSVPVGAETASGYVYALCANVDGGLPNPGWAGS